MTTSENDEDDQPPTAAAADGDATIFVPPPRQAPPDLAWSKADDAGFVQRQFWRLSWGHVAMLVACAGTVALTASIVGWALTRTQHDAAPPSPMTNPPTSWAAPAPPPWMPTTVMSTPLPESPAAPLRISGSLPGTDDLGWTAYPGARCDPRTKPVVMGRTTLSVVVVCEIQPGDFYYRGLRLRDGASIELANAVRSSAGFDVTNPTDGTVYRIRPTGLTITPPDGLASSEPMLEYASS